MSHRKRSKRLILAMATASMTVIACGDDQSPDDAKALLTKIRAENYRGWTRAPGYESRRSTRSPHSGEVEIYVNSVVATAISTGKPLSTWPEGSIIVKDGWDGADLELIAVMEKRADGWFWAEYFDDESKYSGKPSLCTDCHASGADFVRAFPLPR